MPNYLDLVGRWSEDSHTSGSPELDALIIMTLQGAYEQIIAGDYFSASTIRQNVASGETHYRVIQTNNSYLAIDDIEIQVDYGGITNGQFVTEVDLFASDSSRNSFTVTSGTPEKTGVPMNLDYVYKLSESDFIADAEAQLSGDPDFVIYRSDYYRETNGPREMLTGDKSQFFGKGRRLILSPNKTYLFRTRTSGNGGGTVNMRTVFNFIERVQLNG